MTFVSQHLAVTMLAVAPKMITQFVNVSAITTETHTKDVAQNVLAIPIVQ